MKRTVLAVTACVALNVFAAERPAYLDVSRSFEERAADLVAQMTLDEKFGQLGRNTIAVPRLGVAKYDYWNEALHGIQNGTGEGTSFPMPLSLAVTWDEDLIRRVASAIADECRGHNQPAVAGGRGRGLTYWCPTINLARHPLWGRTNEAYGEDAYVGGRLASAFVEGMKGDDAKYLKTVPTIKHYALNNHENLRGSTSSDASEADIRDYYARIYRYVVERTDVPSLMSAYNAVNDTPSSANPFLLTTLLRETFGFTGFVVSDCGAIDNIERQQRWQPAKNTVQKGNYALLAGKRLADYVNPETGVVTKPGSVALALMAGNDMDCNGDIYPVFARRAYEAGLLTESQLNLNVYNNLLARFKLGEFDPDDQVAYRGDAYAFANTVETRAHRALADEAAARSVVLLKNAANTLPLDVRTLRRLVVVGDRADTCFLGNYCGKPKEKNRISVFTGLADYLFVNNRATALTLVDRFGEGGAIRAEDRDAIAAADCVLVVAADEHDDSSEGHDRPALTLSRHQDEIICNVAKLNPKTVVFLQTSNMVEIRRFKDRVKAILWSSQNGQGQGVGLARQVFGEVNPSGKLTFTWYADEAQIPGIRQYGLTKKFLPEEKDYPAGGYTYQYYTGAVEYPFGYGLSYTTFAYSNATVDRTSVDANGALAVSVDVKNTGRRAGSEIVQVYVAYPRGRGLPAKQIKGYAKVDLKAGETKTVKIAVDIADCCFWDGTRRVVPNGAYGIEIGASSTDIRARKTVSVTGALAETINVLTAKPSDVATKAGGTVTTAVRFSLRDDRLLDGSAAKLTFASSNPQVADVDAKGVVTGVRPGTATITVKAVYKGSEKTVSYPIAVSDGVKLESVGAVQWTKRGLSPVVARPEPGVNREALEEAVRVRVQGDDYDPETFAAYTREIRRARAVLFDADATQAQVDAASAALMKVKDNLRDFRYRVADFRDANRLWHFNSGKSIWINWSRHRDAQGREAEADLSTHDPKKLQLRFRLTLEPSDYRTPFDKAVAGGSFIKLRSRDVSQKDNDPDLQVFGGTMSQNNEHNYGWRLTDYVKDWGATDVVIPLATANPDGQAGLPYVDKGFAAKGPARSSRGKIDWSTIDRFFANINFQDAFKRTASVSARVENCRIVDVTLEEERERLQALLDERLEGGCDCPGKIATYENVLIKAREALQGESVVAIRRAAAALKTARQDAGYRATADRAVLRKLIDARVRDFSRYTPESADAYKALYRAANRTLRDPKATQLAVNQAVRSLDGAKGLLKLIRVAPRRLATLVDERSVERHGLFVSADCNLDLAAHADYDVTVRYEVKIDCTHPNAPKNGKWLRKLVNGRARAWGADKSDQTAVVIAAISCLKDSPLAAYEKPGTWMPLTHRIPVAKLAGGRLTRFETGLFNDGNGYVSDPDDGNAWNNDTGVRLTVRNLALYTDKPE